MMTEYQMEMWWVGLFTIGKGLTYLLAMASMIKYLWS
jgi:hypothetical protein